MKYSNLLGTFLIISTNLAHTQDSLTHRFQNMFTLIRLSMTERHTNSSKYRAQSLRSEYKKAMRELHGNSLRTKVAKKPRAPRPTTETDTPDPVLKGLSRRTRELYEHN